MPTGRRRPQQVADLLREELAALIRRDLRDPGVGFVTLTGVDLTDDLRNARVYVSVLGDEGREREAIEALRRATGFLRRAIASRLGLRLVPHLAFFADASVRQGARIEDLLTDLHLAEGDE
jgi:ribosome-binding factor A